MKKSIGLYGQRLIEAQEMRKEMNKTLSVIITDMKNEIARLQAGLKEIAMDFAGLPSVQEHLSEYLSNSRVLAMPRCIPAQFDAPRNRKCGRIRTIPRLKLTFNNGETFVFKPNPNRNFIANRIQKNPDIKWSFEMGEQNKSIYLSDGGEQLRLGNPLRENFSGVKSLTIA